jgi:hypothetical protein
MSSGLVSERLSRTSPDVGDGQRRDLLHWLSPWLPVALGGLGALVVLVRMPHIIGVLYTDGDVASAPVIAALIGHAPGSRTVLLGQFPWYESLWFMRLTHGLPGYREIWEAAPVAFTALGYGLVVLCAWVCFGRTRALLVAALLAGTTVSLRKTLFTMDFHGPLVIHDCVLLAALVLVLRARLSNWAVGALAVIVGAITAVGVASDKTMFIAGIAPLLLAGILLWAWTRQARERRAALFALAVCAIAVLGGALATTAMHNDHVTPTGYTVSFVAPEHLIANLEIFINAFAYLVGGNFFGAPVGATSFLMFAAAVLGFAALFAVVRWLWRRAPALLVHPGEEESPQTAAGVGYILFWALVLICLTGGFLLSSSPINLISARYIAADFVALAALLPVLAPLERRAAHTAVVLAISLFLALGLYFDVSEITGPTSAYPYPNGRTVGEIERYLLAHRAARGYAPYWDAADITWGTNLRIHAYPLTGCATPLGVCPMPLNQISSWYAPSGAHATFLLTDPTTTSNIPVPTAFGAPVAQAIFGNVHVYVYNHDVAAALSSGG